MLDKRDPTDLIVADLEASGLEASDIRARLMANPEHAATNVPMGVSGYVIPYYDLESVPIAFYRCRMFDFDPKYKQTRNTPNHIYLPRGVKKLILDHKYVIITEGEKKAACAVKNGFPCVAVSGVDSWKNRTLTLPEGTKFHPVPGKEQISVKMGDLDFSSIEEESTLATGLTNLIDLVSGIKGKFVICYDTDLEGVSVDVQRAAAGLGFELRYKGIQFQNIKQLILPKEGDRKWGIDDYIVDRSADKFDSLVNECLASERNFPRHPNVQDYISKRLGRSKLGRKESQQVALAILADLDVRGNRLRNSGTGDMYFFDNATRELMDATLRRSAQDLLVDTPFGRYLWKSYGLGPSDVRVLTWVTTMFTAEDPVGLCEPSKVIAIRGDTICYQINDGQYVAVGSGTDKPFRVLNNGAEGVLFTSGLVKPIDAAALQAELNKQLKAPIVPLWPKVLSEVRLKNRDKFATLIGMLFYLSPWINRWRGTQLPIEMALGEPGAGKSSVYEVRLQILVGSPDLRNAPGDLKDWYASIASTGGLHVTDNVQMMDKFLRQRLSDEMCRLVTEPVPHVEMRKYYTNSDLVRVPIYSCFAITAVQQPFHNADLMQRSVIIEFDKGVDQVDYVSRWSTMQLDKYGGRTAWLAHHLVVLHKFLVEAVKTWDNSYRAKYRLMNVEQAFIVLAKVLGIESSWIPEYLTGGVMDATRGADWAFEGICEFCTDHIRDNPGTYKTIRITSAVISSWAMDNDEFSQCIQLTNARSLGRYIQSHKQQLAEIAGLRYHGKYGNRDFFHVEEVKNSMVQEK